MKRALRTQVIGVGCGAGRALNRLWTTRLPGVTCVAVNTDREVLNACRAPTKILLERTDGGDAGGSLEIGRWAAVAAYEQFVAAIQGADVVVLIATLGGGTGSGAAPVMADIAKRYGCFTVAVVTLPFPLEGQRRLATAERGRQELQPQVDTLLTIGLERLLPVVGKQPPLRTVLHFGDRIVHQTVYSMVHTITCADDRAFFAAAQADLATDPMPRANTYAEARALLARMGQACVATGVACGEHRGAKATWRAVTSPLLEPFALKRARAVLLSLTGGPDLTQADVSNATSVVREMTRTEVLIRPSWNLVDHPPGEVWVTVLAA